MPEQMQFPFQLTDVFFIDFHCQRQPTVPEPVKLGVKVDLKVVYDAFPDLEVFLKLESIDPNGPVSFQAEVVGKFALAPEQPKPELDIIPMFISQRAYFILWPVISQQIRQMTGLMGMSAIQLHMPPEFMVDMEEAFARGRAIEGKQP